MQKNMFLGDIFNYREDHGVIRTICVKGRVGESGQWAKNGINGK